MPSSYNARQSLSTTKTDLVIEPPPPPPPPASLSESNLNANQEAQTKPPKTIEVEGGPSNHSHSVDISALNSKKTMAKSTKSASHSKNSNSHKMPPQSPSSPVAALLPPMDASSTQGTYTPKKKKKSIRRRFKKMFHSSKKSSRGSHYNDTDSTTISSSCLASVKTFGTIELDSEQGGVDDLDFIQDYEDFYQENFKEASLSFADAEESSKGHNSQVNSVTSTFLIGGTISLPAEGDEPLRARASTEDMLKIEDDQKEEKEILKPKHISHVDIAVNNEDQNPSESSSPPPSLSPVQKIESLTEHGRIFYRYRLYKDALQVLQEAMDLIPTSSHDLNGDGESGQDEQKLDSFWSMKKAMITYQTTKVRYKVSLENKSTVTAKSEQNGNEDKDNEELQGVEEPIDEQRLYQQMQNEKYKVHTTSIEYYKDELIRIQKDEGSQGDDNNTNERKVVDIVDMDISNLEKVCHTLYLLHGIGKLYDRSLSLYTKALEYYSQALVLENRVLRDLQSKQENNANEGVSASTNEADRKEFKQWNMNARLTRKKMGKLYYITGQMNMALKSSFASNAV